MIVPWSGILAQEGVRHFFASAWREQRLGHAFLFIGRDGVGKRTFALALAQALLCDRANPRELGACGECSGCMLVAAGTHPDLMVAGRPEENNNLPIEVIRELSQALGLKPARGHHKVAILDDADDLDDTAANCFLKTLEEPPPSSILILLGRSIEVQLPTIISRCRVVRFLPWPREIMEQVLVDRGVTEAAQRERLIQLAGGSVGQALALTDPEIQNFRDELYRMLAEAKPDTMAFGKRFSEFVQEAGKDSGPKRRRAALVIRLWVEALQAALRHRVGDPLEWLSASEKLGVRQLGDALGETKLMRLIDRSIAAEHHIDRKVQLDLLIEAYVDQLARVPYGRPVVRPLGD